MPAKPFDIKEYINSLKLSPEDQKAVEPFLSKPEVVEEIKRGWNSQSESSRLVDEANAVKTAAAAEKAEAERIKAEVDAARARNQSWADALTTYEADTKATESERDTLKQEREVLAAKSAGYEAYIKQMGLEPVDALEGVRMPPPPAPKELAPVNQPPAFDEAAFAKLGYIKREEVGNAARALADLPFEVAVLNQRHMELYGKPVPAAELSAMKADFLNPENTRTLSDIAAEKLHFGEREKAIQEETMEREIARRSEEAFTKRMSELNLPSAALDSLTPQSVESAVKFASKGFADNVRASNPNTSEISAEEMQQFLQADQELAQQGIRPGG